ncbi:g11253 [Coccomyxa viridis]|uniref:G11253 protein n=1 Tax=Coccomyxa viridis TaxID=1274662 RepID=A0ABP1G8Q2_9CHLO
MAASSALPAIEIPWNQAQGIKEAGDEGNKEVALRDAAKAAILLEPQKKQPEGRARLGKALFRKGSAHAAKDQLYEALEAFRAAARLMKDSALKMAIGDVLQELSASGVAKYWLDFIEDAQQPILMSSRDGKLLKPVPPASRLSSTRLHHFLERVMDAAHMAAEARRMLCDCWCAGTDPGRAHVALMRGHAYLQASNADQAWKDSSVALSYGPQLEGACTSAHAHALHALAWEGLKDTVMAALAMQRALELDSEEPQWRAERDRLLLCIPEHTSALLQEGGSKALDEWLEEEKERNMPEFKKRRPKYYYYFEWMKERISQHCGELPAPVLDKLLNIEAGELDTLLNYPKGIQAKAGQICGVLEEQGEAYLETWQVPMLTWDELQELKQLYEAAPIAALESPLGEVHSLLEGSDVESAPLPPIEEEHNELDSDIDLDAMD